MSSSRSNIRKKSTTPSFAKTKVLKKTQHKVVKKNNKKRVIVTKKKPITKNLNETNRNMPRTIISCNDIIVNHLKPFTKATDVVFNWTFTDNIHEEMINIITKYAENKIVVGCVAWLSSQKIIDAFKIAKGVSFIVNDEQYSTWGGGCITREKYEQLPHFPKSPRELWKNKLESPMLLAKNIYEPVRCFGTGDERRGNVQLGTPLMHTKFFVICDEKNIPKYVWEGSMNFTANSSNNIESCNFSESRQKALHMFLFFSNIFVNSKTIRY